VPAAAVARKVQTETGQGSLPFPLREPWRFPGRIPVARLQDIGPAKYSICLTRPPALPPEKAAWRQGGTGPPYSKDP